MGTDPLAGPETKFDRNRKGKTLKAGIMRALAGSLLVVSLFASACSSPGSDSLKVGIYPNLINNFDFHVAESKGFFEENGLDVQPVTINTGPDMVSALLSGSVEISSQSTPTVLPVITNQGEDIKLLYGGLELSFLLIANPDVNVPEPSSDLEAVRALRGKTIGVTAAGALTDWFARSLLTEAGLDPDEDVTIVTTGGTGTLTPALQAGRVDAAVIWNTDKTRVGAEGEDYQVVASVLDGTAGPNYDGVLQEYYAATSQFLEENGDKALSYCEASNQAWKWMLDPANESEVVSMLAAWVKIEEAAAESLWLEEKDRFIHYVDPPVWEKQQMLLADGQLPSYEVAVDAACTEVFEGESE